MLLTNEPNEPNGSNGSNKKNKGFTLVELIITMVAVVIVLVVLGNAMLSLFQQQHFAERLRADQYNIRMAALAITRQVRHGYADVVIDYSNPNILRLEYDGGAAIIYTINAGGELVRTTEGSPPITLPFVPVELSDFEVERREIEITGTPPNEYAIFNPDDDGNWLSMTLTGVEGIEIETIISISRIN